MKRVVFSKTAKGPLEDVRVLDLSRVFAGNSLSFYLGDFGADVLKIEQPGMGDTLRAIRDGGHSIQWKVICRNKRSLALDLKRDEGKAILLDLVRQTQVLIENFRPGDLERLGFAPAMLHEINPKLVIVRISGWGATGPYRDKLGFGTLIEAFSGFAAKNGFPGSPPLLPNMGLADFVCGMTGGIATLVALREAERPEGLGQVVDLSILDSMVTLLGNDPAAYAVTGVLPERVGNRGQVAVPRNLYRTLDGKFMALSASTPTMAHKVMVAIEHPELNEDPRFIDNDARMKHADVLDAYIEEFTSARNLEENLIHFEGHQVTVGPVNDVDLLLKDRHILERGVLIEIDDEDVGAIPVPAPPARLSATPATLRYPAPRLGEHSREVLQSLGLADERIDHLVSSGVVGAPG